MNHDYKTAFCSIVGAVAGAAFFAQSWGLLLGMILLLLPWEYMGKVALEGIVEAAKWIEEKRVQRARENF